MQQRMIPVAMLALPLWLNAELLPIRSYSTADGLAADRVNQILVDSRGFVWFCTPEGLSRFDGYRFRKHASDFQSDVDNCDYPQVRTGVARCARRGVRLRDHKLYTL